MLQYYGYHQKLLEASHRKSSKKKTIMMVAHDLNKWWLKGPGVEIMKILSIYNKVTRLVNRYEDLKKRVNRSGGKEDVKRKSYLKELSETFWMVSKETEEKMKNSTDLNTITDYKYLMSVKGSERTGTFGPVDSKVAKKNKRKIMRKQQKERKLKKNDSSLNGENIESLSSSEEEIDGDEDEVVFNLNKQKNPNLKKRKKQAVTPAICAVALKSQLSSRTTFMMVGASMSDNELIQSTLSVSTVQRSMKKFAVTASESIISNKLAIPSAHYTLHWDGKIFKSLTHCGKNKERVAVLLTASNGEEILLGVIEVENGTAAEEHDAILKLLYERKIPLDKISSCVFDTTAVNTGELSGIVRRLETSLGHSILELACRHHMYELVCGAASEIILGKPQQGKGTKKTTAPYEPLFKKLCESWENIDKDNYTSFETKSLPRILISHINEAKKFLTEWLCNEKSSRNDYLEMAKLCLTYIGGDLPEKMSPLKMREPGAYHHARWMSKVLYVLKLAMLKPTFTYEVEKIRSLALFYSVYYAKAWLTSIFAAEAPVQDLTIFKALEEVCNTKGNWPVEFQHIAEAAKTKLSYHTWYLSERLVALALFSDNPDIVDIPTKERMRKAILNQKNKNPTHTEQQRPECSSYKKKQLSDFVGRDTITFFKLLHLDEDLLTKHVSEWNLSLNYRDGVEMIKNLSVVNDASERALGLATTLHGPTMPKKEKNIQAIFKVVHEIHNIQKTVAKSTERINRRTLVKFLKSSMIQAN